MPLIFAPPGSGKSTWVASHSPLWQDGDELHSHLHDLSWHKSGPHDERAERDHYRRIDEELERDRKTLNIVTSLYWDTVPDAVVRINPAVHKKYVEERGDLNWDNVQEIQRDMESRVGPESIYDSFDEAAAAVLAKTAVTNSFVETCV